MKRKLLLLFIICLSILCLTTAVSAENNNTTESNVLLVDENNVDTVEISQDAQLSDGEVTAQTGGIRNVTFSDGYNGYCINLSKDHAESGDTFTPVDTSHAINDKYNTPIGNYLKILFVDFYDFAISDADETSEVIWDFSNRYYQDSQNPITQAILELSKTRGEIPDHGETKMINDDTMAIFDFEVFNPYSSDIQNYFGYRITYEKIKHDEDENKTSDENQTNETKTTNETTVNNSTNKTTENNTTNESTTENSTTIHENTKNTTSTATQQTEDQENTTNQTYKTSNSNSSHTIQSKTSTGNPIFLIILVLITCVAGMLRIRKE